MNRPKYLVVSVHDVAPPHWNRVARMLEALTAGGVPHRSLLVVPNYHGRWPIDRDEGFCGWLRDRQAKGDEIVLHGYEHTAAGQPRNLREHLKNRWYTQGEGEFLSLDYADARTRLELGKAMTSRAKLETRGFVAPAWLISQEGLRAAREGGFQYTNSYLKFADLASGRTRIVPSLVFGPGHLNEDLGIAAQRRMARLLRRVRTVRVVLHPPCVDHVRRFDQILTMVKELRSDREAITYHELLVFLRSRGSDGHGA